MMKFTLLTVLVSTLSLNCFAAEKAVSRKPASVGKLYELSGNRFAQEMAVPGYNAGSAYASGEAFCGILANEKKLVFVNVDVVDVDVTTEEGPNTSRVICIFKKQ